MLGTYYDLGYFFFYIVDLNLVYVVYVMDFRVFRVFRGDLAIGR